MVNAQFSITNPPEIQKLFSQDYGNNLNGTQVILALPTKKILQFINSGSKVVISQHFQLGALDPNFGTNGTVSSSFGGVSAYLSEAKILQNGKFLICGEIITNNTPIQGKMLLAQFKPNGSLDSSFGQFGIAKIPLGTSVRNYAWGFDILSDSTYLLGGSFHFGISRDFLLVKVKRNGTIDSTFGTNGFETRDLSLGDDINNVVSSTSGTAFIVGNVKTGNSRYDFAVIKTTNNGIDNTFGTNGILTFSLGNNDSNPYRVIINSNGNLLLGGQVVNSNGYNDMGLAQIFPNGTLDNSFGIGGKIIIPISSMNNGIRSMQLLDNGKILIGGFGQTVSGSMYSAIVQLEKNGALTTTFGINGILNLPNKITTIYNTNQGSVPFCATMVTQVPWDTSVIYCNTANLENTNHAAALFKYSGGNTFSIFDNCLAYFPFNGDYRDYSGNNQHILTVAGTRFTSDRFNAKLSAVSFAGGSDRLIIPTSTLLGTINNGLTISLWLNQTSANCFNCSEQFSPYGYIITSKTNSTSPFGGFKFTTNGTGLNPTTSGRRFGFNANFSATGISLGTNSDYELQDWNHVCIVYDLKTTKFYLNGILTSSSSGILPSITSNNLPLAIGGPSDDGTNNLGLNFKGLIDEFRLYNRALSLDEINILQKQYQTISQCLDETTQNISVEDQSVGFYTIAHSDMRLKYLDTKGTITDIGPTGISQKANYPYGGMDFAPNGKLYLTTSNDSIYEMNVSTGRATFISRLIEPGNTEDHLSSISFNPAGQLYIMDEISDFPAGKLRKAVNLETGVATSLSTNNTGMPSILGIEFDDKGNLWALDDCCIGATFQLNTNTGVATGFLPSNTNQVVPTDLDYTNGTLYGLSVGYSQITTLYSANLTNGSTQNILTLPGIYIGLAGKYNTYQGDSLVTYTRRRVDIRSTLTITRFVGISKTNESTLSLELSVFPNPTTGFIQIVDTKNEAQFFTLTDGLGVEQEKGTVTSKITFADKPKGIYFLRLYNHTNEMILNQKIIFE